MVTKNDQQKGHNVLATFKQHRNKKQRNTKRIKRFNPMDGQMETRKPFMTHV